MIFTPLLPPIPVEGGDIYCEIPIFYWGSQASILGAAVWIEWHRSVRTELVAFLEIGSLQSETRGADGIFDGLVSDLRDLDLIVNITERGAAQCQIISRATAEIRTIWQNHGLLSGLDPFSVSIRFYRYL